MSTTTICRQCLRAARIPRSRGVNSLISEASACRLAVTNSQWLPLNQSQPFSSTPSTSRTVQKTSRTLPVRHEQEERIPLPNLLSQRIKYVHKAKEVSDKLVKVGFRPAQINELLDEYMALATSAVSSRWKENVLHFPSSRQCRRAYESQGIPALDHLIFKNLVAYASKQPKYVTERFEFFRNHAELRYPAEWYPGARRMHRHIIAHVGPTNSGKTYAALQALREAPRGIYLGPLRMLAHEVCNRLNAEGRPCNLRTGEEKRTYDANATTWSATCEMLDMELDFDVAVLDEGQLLADRERGSAWTTALLGIKAKELHVCGDPAMVKILEKIVAQTGDKLVVHRYERLSPLRLDTKSLHSDLGNVRPGDCVVAFSRRNIFAIKQQIENETGLQCAVVYGSLPPEVRAKQAELFNNGDPKAQVLVASDAIGMGLNLKVRRIVFESMIKFTGRDDTPLEIPLIKQISGRAGRYFGQDKDASPGLVTTLHESDRAYLEAAIRSPVIDLQTAYINLRPDDILAMCNLGDADGPITLSEALELSYAIAESSGSIFTIGEVDGLISNIKIVESALRTVSSDMGKTVTIPQVNLLTWGHAPVSNDDVVRTAFDAFARIFAVGASCRVQDLVDLSPYRAPDPRPFTDEPWTLPGPPRNPIDLRNLESIHRVILLYLWLALRFTASFNDIESAMKLKDECESIIQESLSIIRYNKKKGRMSGVGRASRAAKPLIKRWEPQQPKQIMEMIEKRMSEATHEEPLRASAG